MSSTIKQAIEALKTRIESAYDAVVEKGGTLPATQDSASLPTAIESIPSGVPDYNTYRAGYRILDVAQLYTGTANRPKILYSPNVTQLRYFLDPSLFYGGGIQEVNFPNCTSIRINSRGLSFENNSDLRKIVLPSLIEIGLYRSNYGLFSSSYNLEYVEFGAVTSLWQNSELNILGVYDRTTSYYAYNLEMFKMGNGWNVPLNLRNWFGTNVSADTIDANVRSGLADTCRDNTGATAKTIKFNSNLYAKLSEETKQIFTDKNWILQSL